MKECKKRGSREKKPRKKTPDPKRNTNPNLTLTLTLTLYEGFFSSGFPGTKKRNYIIISYKSLSSKVYDSFILRRNVWVLALQCFCGYNIKQGLLQNTCFEESTNMPVEILK